MINRSAVLSLALSLGASAIATAQSASPLSDARIATLPDSQRPAWQRYVERSRNVAAEERAAMARELATAGLAKTVRAPLAAESFTFTPAMRAGAWLASDSARRVADIAVSFQDPAGGWSKHVDLRSHVRRPGESYTAEGDDWQWVGTTDLGSTTSEIELLLAVDSARGTSTYLPSARRGVEYLLGSQMPNGCWPQVYPLMGGYHDAVAVADDATSTILSLLRRVAHGVNALTNGDSTLAPRAAAARAKGVQCVLALQRSVGGTPAGWTFYYDPLDGRSLPGRSWEPPALAPLETASLLDELIADSLPSRDAEWAAHGAAAWLQREGMAGYEYQGFELRPRLGAPLLWPRLIALDDGRPLFSNRDGVRRADWSELTDRRSGYLWFGGEPEMVLDRYARWATTHPAWGALAPARVPTDSVAKLPGRRVERDTSSLVAPARLRGLPSAVRESWARYVARSRELARLDRTSMDGELARTSRQTMRRGAWSHDFSVTPAMTRAWFATDTARRMAESILSYQTPSGGWSKHVDFGAGVRLPGVSYNGESAEWRFIPTIDNASTTEEIRFLALADSVHPDPRYRAAIDAGVRYLLDAQMPTGCWPQVFPLEGGYHDAATFNDDAIVNVAQVMRDVASGAIPVASPRVRNNARYAERAAIRCMLDAQVRVKGRLTVWGQQHDPVTLRPTSARSYELASLTADESVPVARFLMDTPNPDQRVINALHAAAAWFRAHAVHGLAYEHYQLTRRADAPPLWGRMVDLERGRPFFVNRDGVKSFDFARLTDRRTGYRWYTAAPADFLRDYDRWALTHPQPAASRTNLHPSARR